MGGRLVTAAALTAIVVLALAVVVGRRVDPFGFYLPKGEPHRSLSSDGVDRRPAYIVDRGLLKLIELDRVIAGLGPGERLSVIVGDSIGLQIEPRVVEGRLGGRWHNVAYGTASVAENLDLLDHLLGRWEIERLVWSLSLARVRTGGRDQMPRTLFMARRPWRHFLTAQSLAASFYVLRKAWTGIDHADPPPPVPDAWLPAWGIERLRIEHVAAEWPHELAERLAALADRARERRVRLEIVVPPMHPDTWAMFASVLPERSRDFEALLQGHCTLRLDRAGTWPAAGFRDALHLRSDLHPRLSDALADGLAAGCG